MSSKTIRDDEIIFHIILNLFLVLANPLLFFFVIWSHVNEMTISIQIDEIFETTINSV